MRKGKKLEAAGFLLILAGMGGCMTGQTHPLWSVLTIVGFIIFLIGRFL